jgi:type VI secretion system protein ImpJ
MYGYNKVIWSEGMLLQQQHLQQHDRYWQRIIDMRSRKRPGADWGFSRLLIDDALLQQGKLALLECEAILPDGTPLSLPHHDPLPAPLDIPPTHRNVDIVLALPLAPPGLPECGDSSAARYRVAECMVTDNTAPAQEPVQLQVGTLQLQLALATEVADAYTSIGVARIIERRSDNRLILDNDYIPPCLDIHAAPVLARFVRELAGLLHQRGDTLVTRMTQTDIGTVARMADLLLLQIVNRNEPLFIHLADQTGIHPEMLWQQLLQLAGELATHHAPYRLPELPLYRHGQLDQAFIPLSRLLRNLLQHVADPQAFAIALEPQGPGHHLAIIPDSALFSHAVFVLAARADMSEDKLVELLPTHIKIGPIERIAELVNLQLPAIDLQPLATAPQQIPYHAGYRYFALDKTNAFWPQLSQSAGLAVHVAGAFPSLSLELWAIRAQEGWP